MDGSRVVAAHARSLKGDEVLVLDHSLEFLATSPGRCPLPLHWPGPELRERSEPPRSASGLRPGADSGTGTGPGR